VSNIYGKARSRRHEDGPAWIIGTNSTDNVEKSASFRENIENLHEIEFGTKMNT
jgi:hypothetical protein